MASAGTFYLLNKQEYQIEETPPKTEISQIIAKQEKPGEQVKLEESDKLEKSEVEVGSSPSALIEEPDKDFINEALSLPNDKPKETELPKLPESLNLESTFYPQAPFGNWNMPWQEACEEASVLLIANTYLDKNWSKAEFNQQILKIVDWEIERFGQYEHTDAAQTAIMLEENFGLESIIHTNPSEEDIKDILNDGHLIIGLFSGQTLGNPYYSDDGPVYHAMVIKGYEEGGKIIVSDVGTKRGENYVYSWNTINNSLHEYAEPISKGDKKIIEVLPNHPD